MLFRNDGTVNAFIFIKFVCFNSAWCACVCTLVCVCVWLALFNENSTTDFLHNAKEFESNIFTEMIYIF